MLLCYQTISLIKSMCFSDFTNQNMKICTFMCIDVLSSDERFDSSGEKRVNCHSIT